MKTKPIKLVCSTRSIGKGKTLDEGTSLTTSSMVWHPYHMTHTSTLITLIFPHRGTDISFYKGAIALQKWKNPQIFPRYNYVHLMYMEP